MTGKNEKIEMHSKVKVAAKLLVRIRRNFAVPHLMAAAEFSLRAQELETEHKGKGFGPHWDKIRAYVTSAIVMANASMEANFNEISKDLGVDEEFLQAIDRAPFMMRHQALLVHRGAEKFNLGAAPAQNVAALNRLRNELVHSKPFWDDESGPHDKIGDTLKGIGFHMSPFLEEHEQVFPMRCMSHGCAQWATVSALEFNREFTLRMGLDLKPWEREYQTQSLD